MILVFSSDLKFATRRSVFVGLFFIYFIYLNFKFTEKIERSGKIFYYILPYYVKLSNIYMHCDSVNFFISFDFLCKLVYKVVTIK